MSRAGDMTFQRCEHPWKQMTANRHTPVKIYRFQTAADYPEGSGFGGSGPDAYERFSTVMIPLMIRRGAHPIYGSNWVDRSNSKWDRIVIVRYRSRRDLVDIFATDAFADASLHKWASLRGHDRMLVQALHIPDGRYAILFLALIAAICNLWRWNARETASTSGGNRVTAGLFHSAELRPRDLRMFPAIPVSQCCRFRLA